MLGRSLAILAALALSSLTVAFGAWAVIAVALGAFFAAAAALVLALWGGVLAIATAFFMGSSSARRRRPRPLVAADAGSKLLKQS
jgi:hypothetical protein